MDQYIADKKEEKEIKNNIIKTINIILIIAIILLSLILISMSFLWSPMTVSGPSMEPTFCDGDKIILLKMGYSIEINDVIIFKKSDNRKVIKRVIALPGDYIRYNEEEKAWYRNDKKLVEKYIKEDYSIKYISHNDLEFYSKITSEEGILVGKDELFVLGDNRNISNDSHVYGCIEKNQIIGKFLFRY